jgi:hypothetical protein
MTTEAASDASLAAKLLAVDHLGLGCFLLDGATYAITRRFLDRLAVLLPSASPSGKFRHISPTIVCSAASTSADRSPAARSSPSRVCSQRSPAASPRCPSPGRRPSVSCRPTSPSMPIRPARPCRVTAKRPPDDCELRAKARHTSE